MELPASVSCGTAGFVRNRLAIANNEFQRQSTSPSSNGLTSRVGGSVVGLKEMASAMPELECCFF